eukprot:1143507-Pelagomonas_calceolata.AAC.2
MLGGRHQPLALDICTYVRPSNLFTFGRNQNLSVEAQQEQLSPASSRGNPSFDSTTRCTARPNNLLCFDKQVCLACTSSVRVGGALGEPRWASST